MSGFCMNVGLCCVNKFKVERERERLGGREREEGLGSLKSYF